MGITITEARVNYSKTMQSSIGDYKCVRRPGPIGSTSGLTLGFEIEVVHEFLEYEDDDDDCESELSEVALSAIKDSGNAGRIIAEYDGSLDDGGVEFITGFCIWEAHKADLESFCDYLQSNNFREHSTAGVHIHVGRSGIRDEEVTWSRVYWFCMGSLNSSFMRFVSGRYNTEFCRSDKNVPLTWEAFSRVSNDRYNCVNRRDETYEFRCFHSTTDFDVLKRYAEFVLAVVEYCSITDFGDLSPVEAISYKRFLTWLRESRAKKYPTLVADTNHLN